MRSVMKILILNSILYTSETNRIPEVKSIKDTMIYTLCMGFLALGHTPVLVAEEDYRPTEQESYPFKVVFLPGALKKIFPPRCLPFQPALRKYLKDNRSGFDLVITSEVFSLCSLMAVRTMPEKVIVWHELGKHNRIFKTIPSRLWYNIIARLFFRNVLIVPRSQTAYDFISHYCNNISRMCIEHGVDLSLFQVSPLKEKQFAVVSQLIDRKQIDGVINFFADFRKHYDLGGEYHLYIIGDGVLRQRLQEQVKKLCLGDSVIFTGRLSHADMVGILSKSLAMLVNTKQDNNMVSIAESIACGTPVLTNTVPYNSVSIQQNHLGIVRDSWNSEDMNEIVKKNEFFIKNCLAFRDRLSGVACAEQFLWMRNREQPLGEFKTRNREL